MSSNLDNVSPSRSVLQIDLGAVRRNYRRLLQELAGVPSAAVIKADGYGLGAERVLPALYKEGCRIFFVATLEEGVRLRPSAPTDAQICILNGVLPGTESAFREFDLTPVLNSLDQIALWRGFGEKLGQPLPAQLHVDTGMNRLGLGPDEWARVESAPELLDGIAWQYLMSHLCSADLPSDPMNRQQLNQFSSAFKTVSGRMKACFANSSGIFLGPDYHFDLARPGVALFGGRPSAEAPNPLECPIRIEGRVLQLRTVAVGEPVGYASSWKAQRESRIATLSVGYADGYIRSLSGQGMVMVGETPCPVVGRVSMDLITVDVTDVEPEQIFPGQTVEVLGPAIRPDDMADRAGTIGYELLTSLGRRYDRAYIDSEEA